MIATAKLEPGAYIMLEGSAVEVLDVRPVGMDMASGQPTFVVEVCHDDGRDEVVTFGPQVEPAPGPAPDPEPAPEVEVENGAGGGDGPAMAPSPPPSPQPTVAPDFTPVGAGEIARALGVAEQTVRAWRLRSVGLPDPEWRIGGRPVWAWSTIEAWARESGRLPAAS